MGYAYPSNNSGKNRKYGNTNEIHDAGGLLRVITEVKKGDLSVCMSIDGTGIAGKIYDSSNDVIELNKKKHVRKYEKCNGNT